MEDKIVLEIEEVATFFHKSPRQVYRWFEKGAPRLSGGRYDLDAIQGWRKRKKKTYKHPAEVYCRQRLGSCWERNLKNSF